jgi:hypothetical protein
MVELTKAKRSTIIASKKAKTETTNWIPHSHTRRSFVDPNPTTHLFAYSIENHPIPPSQVLLKRTEAQNMPTSAMSIPALQFTACTRNALTPYQTQPCDIKKTVSRVSQKPASHKVSLRRHTRLRRTGCMSDGSARSHHTPLSAHQSYGGIVCMTRHTPFFSATCQIAYQGAEPATGAKGRCQGLLY